MKRIIAGLLSLTAVLCAFTACGHDEGEEITEESSVEEITEEEPTEEVTEEVTEETEEESEEEPTEEATEEVTEGTQAVSAEYLKALQDYVDCVLSGDIEGAVDLSYPSCMKELGMTLAEIEGFDFYEDMSDIMVGFDGITEFVVEGIKSETPLDIQDLEEINAYYTLVKNMCDYIEEVGKDNVTYDMLDEKMEELYEQTEIDIEDIITEAYEIEISAVVTFEDGTTENTDNVTALVCYVDGEGWKIDNTFYGYNMKLKQASADSHAASFYKAGNTALVEFDEEGTEMPEKFIISTDSSKNYNIDPNLAEKFLEKACIFYPEITANECFAVIDKGVVMYTAWIYGNKIGTYPVDTLYNSDKAVPTEYTYEDIYSYTLEAVK